MNIDMSPNPEQIFSWLNRFQESDLSPTSRQYLETAQDCIRQEMYAEATQLLQQVQVINKQSGDRHEKAEVSFESGFAYFLMGDLDSAIHSLNDAIFNFPSGIGNNHKQMISRYMLGAIEWSDDCDHSQAMIHWKKCIDELEELRLRADRENRQTHAEWYADHLTILQTALAERLLRTRPPKTKPEPPLTSTLKPESNPPSTPPTESALPSEDQVTEENHQEFVTNIREPKFHISDLYKDLVMKVHGDRAVADRLIEHERKLFTHDNLYQLIERAIDRLLDDLR